MDFSRWAERLVASGLVDADGVRGHSEEEIARTLAEQPDARPPEVFLDYLRSVGRTTVRHIDVHVSCLGCRYGIEAARDLVETDPDLSLPGKFFIAEHDGYVLWYFGESRPGVHRWIEGRGETPLADTFEEFLEQLFRSALANREAARERERRVKERKSRRQQGS